MDSDRNINVIFFGTPEFAAVGLKYLIDAPNITVAAVVAQPDRPAGRGGRLTLPPVKQLAITHSIPVLQPESLRRELADFKKFSARHGPFDIGVVIAFGQILPADAFSTPAAGCVNVHASLLPRWRGAAPIQRAIMAGDTETGVCLMDVDTGLDQGGVYAHSSIAITEQDDFLSLHNSLADAGGTLLVQHLPDIAGGLLECTPQPQEGITYAAKIDNDEALIDWAGTATDVSRKIRGLSPFPGAFTFLDGKRLKIYRATHNRIASTHNKPPGTILSVSPDAFHVSCGKNALLISDLQLEGKRRMSVREFLPGVQLQAGIHLGAAPSQT